MTGQLGWVVAARSQDLPDGGRLVVEVDGVSVLLLRLDGQVYAIGNHCPHLGCPMARGRIEDFMIICPCHDWTFDIRTGELIIAKEITLPTFRVRVDARQIYLQTVNLE